MAIVITDLHYIFICTVYLRVHDGSESDLDSGNNEVGLNSIFLQIVKCSNCLLIRKNITNILRD